MKWRELIKKASIQTGNVSVNALELATRQIELEHPGFLEEEVVIKPGTTIDEAVTAMSIMITKLRKLLDDDHSSFMHMMDSQERKAADRSRNQ